MPNYTDDVEYAVRESIKAIFREHEVVNTLTERANGINAHVETMYKFFLGADFDDDDIPGGVQAAYVRYMQSRERADNELRELSKELTEVEKSIDIKSKVSLPSLAGTILQIAKQGVSITYGGLNSCPDGRMIKSQSIKHIIWQGRNQSMHFDEGGVYRKPVIDCFQLLEQDFGSGFNLANRAGENLAFEVLKVLGWDNFDQFKADLIALGI